LRLRAGSASKSRLRGQFDEVFTLCNRARLALVPRKSHFVLRYKKFKWDIEVKETSTLKYRIALQFEI
jgi:hypothetical protein